MRIILKILIGIIEFPVVLILAVFLGVVYGLANFIEMIVDVFYAVYYDIFNFGKRKTLDTTIYTIDKTIEPLKEDILK